MNERELIHKWMAWKEENEQKPFSRKNLAESAGMSPTYLSSIMTGIRNAGTRTIERIAEAFGVTLAEFYGGPPDFAESRIPDTSREKSAPPVVLEKSSSIGESKDGTDPKLFRSSPDEKENLLNSYGFALRVDAFTPPSMRNPPPREVFTEEVAETISTGGIPLLTHVPEGPWREWFSPGSKTVFRTIPTPLDGKHLFALQLTDDSMSPILERGALVVAGPSETNIGFKGEIAIVASQGWFSIRRIYAIGESLVLVPVNPAFFPEVIPAEEADVFVISFHIPSQVRA